jgi:hypothetical protein
MAVKSSGTTLTVVSDEIYQLDRKPESPAQRIRRLQNEAKLLAREQIEELTRSIKLLAVQSDEIAQGGEAYPAGIRELASRMSEDLYAKMETFSSLLGRVPMPKLK